MDKRLEKLKSQLLSLSSGENFVEFSKKIMKTSKEIIGVKVPTLRRVAKELEKKPHEFIFSQDGKVFELTLLEGMMISGIRNAEEGKKRIGAYLKKVDSWALVDLLFPLKFISGSEEDFSFFAGFLDGDEFFARFGIVGLLKYFTRIEYFDKVIAVLEGVKCEKYYVLMAEAWLFSEIIIKNPQNAEKIMQKIIKNTQINSFVINMTIQKVCDSYRVGSETKDKLRKLKV